MKIVSKQILQKDMNRRDQLAFLTARLCSQGLRYYINSEKAENNIIGPISSNVLKNNMLLCIVWDALSVSNSQWLCVAWVGWFHLGLSYVQVYFIRKMDSLALDK